MTTLLLIVHVLAAVAAIVLILLHQGKGADAGASFGAGASNTVFGSQGASSFLDRMTAILVAIFFITSFSLAVYARHDANHKTTLGVPQAVPTASEKASLKQAPLLPATTQPAHSENDAPTVEGSSAKHQGDAPKVEGSSAHSAPDAPKTPGSSAVHPKK